MPKEEAKELFDSYTQFEKKHGDRDGIEGVINSKRRFQYEEEVKTNPFNYDAWFSLIRLLESESNLERIQDAYEVRGRGGGGRGRMMDFTCGSAHGLTVFAPRSAPLPTCRRRLRRSTGGATSTCGSTTQSTWS